MSGPCFLSVMSARPPPVSPELCLRALCGPPPPPRGLAKAGLSVGCGPQPALVQDRLALACDKTRSSYHSLCGRNHSARQPHAIRFRSHSFLARAPR